ncbi:MAG TPA: hypothetical protein VGB55_15655, partial [Tepidisphaeraceae bacterium]
LLLMRRRAPVDIVRAQPDQRPVPYHRRRVHPGPPVLFGWWLIGTILLYIAVLSWSVIPFYRYALPVIVLLHALAGLGAFWAARWLSHRRLPAIAIWGGLALIIGGWQGMRCHDFHYQFVDDSRDAVRKWAKGTLPLRARVVADAYVHYHVNRRREADGPRWPRMGGISYAADQGDIKTLQNRGIDYVAVAGTSYERFLSPHTFGTTNREYDFYRREKFYRELFDHYPVVWRREAKYPMHTFTNPNITVFRIGLQKPGMP